MYQLWREKNAVVGSNSHNGCCSCLSSCCHSALANETLSDEPTGERGGVGGALGFGLAQMGGM